MDFTPTPTAEAPAAAHSGVRIGHVDGLGRCVVADRLANACEAVALPGAATNHAPKRKIDKWSRDFCDARGSPTYGALIADIAQRNDLPEDDTINAIRDAMPDARRRMAERVFKWTEAAGGISLGRLFDGRPDFMRRPRDTMTAKPVVAIAVNMSSSAAIKAQVLGLRGMVAAIAADHLRREGYPVELWAVQHSRGAYTGKNEGSERDSFVALRIFKAGQVFTDRDAVNALGASAFRSLTFACIEAAHPSTVSSGLGMPTTLNDEKRVLAQEVMHADRLLFVDATAQSNNFKKELNRAIDATLEGLSAFFDEAEVV